MVHPRRTGKQLTLPRRRSGGISTQRLDKLIAEATVDGHDDAEQITGFQAMLEEHLDLPFKTKVLGLEVTVEAIQLTEAAEMVAVCARGRRRQHVRGDCARALPGAWQELGAIAGLGGGLSGRRCGRCARHACSGERGEARAGMEAS